MTPRLDVRDLHKHFTLHNQGGVTLPVLRGLSLTVEPGECVALSGPSGAGKSTLLRCIFGNYRTDEGQIWVDDGDDTIDVAHASPREIIKLRLHTMGYVSQFLRVVPRVSALDVVGEPLRALGMERWVALERAGRLLHRLNLPERLWSLPPATFSGGEQQRINVARGMIARSPLLLLDEPTASLDATNRGIVVEMICEAVASGIAVVGIFHDAEVRDAVATRCHELEPLARMAA